MRDKFDRLPSDTRTRILERDAYICGYCNGEANEVDHIIPWSYYRHRDDDNLIASCEDCNRIAKDKVFSSLAEKRQYIMSVRSGKKWTRKLNNRYSRCSVCGELFNEGAKGATHFICASCVGSGYEYKYQFEMRDAR